MTLFSDFLTALKAPHTEAYSDSRFNSMPFRSVFGLSKLLQEYGIENQGIFLDDPAELPDVPVPFIAGTPGGMVIVTSIDASGIGYLSQGVAEQASLADFTRAFNGRILVARAGRNSRETDYAAHARTIFFEKAKRVALVALVLFVAVYLFVSNRIYDRWSTVLLTVFNLVGLYFCYLLMGKKLRISSRIADRVCGVLQKGGCDDVLADKASTFYGIFSWSEVGFTYFSVSLLALWIFPQYTSYLAACNVCCLPFTVWSISYQKFVVKAWCTLCVSVQCTLWVLFFCYLGGGWLGGIFPLRLQFFVLVAVYGIVLLTLNRLSPYLERNEK